eukprot:9741110-Ditylum_brightwellii.AAC.1
MSEAVAYRGALTRCGIGGDVQMAVESEGLNTLEKMGLVTQIMLQRMLKSLQERKMTDATTGGDLPQLVIPITAEMTFCGLHKWISTQQGYENTLAATNFTVTVCNTYAWKVKDELEDEDDDDDDIVKPPRQLSANDKWPMYKKLIENYLDTKEVMEEAPLS